MRKLFKISMALVLALLLGFPLSFGNVELFPDALSKAQALSAGKDPVGTNIIVKIAKEKNIAVVNVSVKAKKQNVVQRPRGPQRRGPRGPRGPGGPGGKNDFYDRFQDFFDRFPEQRPRGGTGSGFIIDPEGLILTNHHVVENAESIVVTYDDDKEYDAELIGSDSKTDVALIKIIQEGDSKVKFTHLSLGNSDNLEVGEWVVAIGNPFGLSHTVTTGIVSAKGRNIGAGPYDEFIQTDASINPGNSGGPLLNMDGDVIGINTAIISGNTGGNVGIGFAIPINMTKSIIKDLKETGKVTRGWLGVMIQRITPELAASLGLKGHDGALVGDVIPGSPAAEAGVKRGDVILKFNDVAVKKMEELPKIVAGTRPGQVIPVQIIRDGKEKSLNVTIARLKSKEEKVASLGVNLGATVQDITPELAESMNLDSSAGVLVSEVTPGQPAKESGLRRGDVILEVNRNPVNNVNEFNQAVIKTQKKGTVLMLVKRDGNTIYVAVKLG